MPRPFASTLISVLRTALDLVEKSEYLKSDSPALRDLRQAVAAATVELQEAVNLEPHIEPFRPAGPDFYRRSA